MKNIFYLKRIAATGLLILLTAGMTVHAASGSDDPQAAGLKGNGAQAGASGSGTVSGSQSSGNNTSGSKQEDSDSKTLTDAKKEKEALEQQLANAKKTLSNLKESKGGIEENLRELHASLIQISERIAGLEQQLAQKNNELEAARIELAGARENADRQYQDMKVRIQFMYENGQSTFMEMLLSSGTIAEFLNSAEYISQIEQYDRSKLEEYQSVIARVEAAEAQLEKDYEEIEILKADVEEEKAAVAELMRQRETELAGIKNNISEAMSEAEYFEAELKAAEELIAEIIRIEAEKRAAGITDSPYSGGVFTWPCPSSQTITSNFGPRNSPTAGASSDHKGIDIGASYGADIVAAAPGTVKAATYSSTAGNYIMIDHGGGLYTVYMHASSLVASVGDTVSAGQLIAKVGSTGISTGNHLHFGVSLNGSYVSPWNYLGN